MSVLIEAANECLKDEGLAVQIGIEQEPKFRKNSYGLHYSGTEEVIPVFQLLEREKIIIQHREWDTFLSLIRQEFGLRFTKRTGLDSLRFPSMRDVD